jgi:hypothetical protein
MCYQQKCELCSVTQVKYPWSQCGSGGGGGDRALLCALDPCGAPPITAHALAASRRPSYDSNPVILPSWAWLKSDNPVTVRP